MSLSAGTRLGPYEILVPIGAGGMGEVYRALWRCPVSSGSPKRWPQCRVIELDPNYATAHHWYAMAATGRGEQAIASLRRAQQLDPLSLIEFRMKKASTGAGRCTIDPEFCRCEGGAVTLQGESDGGWTRAAWESPATRRGPTSILRFPGLGAGLIQDVF